MRRKEDYSAVLRVIAPVGALILSIVVFTLPRWIGVLPSGVGLAVTVIMVFLWLLVMWFAIKTLAERKG